MRPIPKKLREEMSRDPFYNGCCRKDEECSGRITWEHCWIYAGKQINEKWAIIPLCWHHHLGEGIEKQLNQYFSLLLSTEEDLKKYPKKDWDQEFNKLNNKYKNDYRTKKFIMWCEVTNRGYKKA